ncbi:MAG: tRNA (adenosine(37)-N6)-dimethylallyltransferase MiaA, partial [Ignavibacteriota bacterium]
AEVRSRIIHHLIDILGADIRFNAAEFAVQARNVLRDILSRGKTPLVVGGTGFYIDALFYGLASVEVEPDKLEVARARVAKEMAEFGFNAMHEKLLSIDGTLYSQIARERNPRRLERAWEYYYATGQPLGEARNAKPEPFEFLPNFNVIEVEREELNRNIVQRIDTMLADRWLDEVIQLLGSGITLEQPAMNAIGYRELVEVAQGRMEITEARELIIIRTRQYAKRQVTWMKRYKNNTI